MDEKVKNALESDLTIDITTTGRRSGQSRRTEIWFHNIHGRLYITGTPGRRDWYANMKANPAFTFHIKQSIRADLPARARSIEEAGERRAILPYILKKVGRDASVLEDWVAGSPLVEVYLED